MVVTVLLTGVPHYVTLQDLARNLNLNLTSEDIGSFVTRELQHPSKPGKRLIALDFTNGFDAMMAQDQLNGFQYKLPNDKKYVLTAKVTSNADYWPNISAMEHLEAPPPPLYSNALVSYSSRRESHIDILDDELLTLDKKIKIVKKKRQLEKQKRKFKKAQKKRKRHTSSDSETDRRRGRRREERRRSRSSSNSSLSNTSQSSWGRQRRRHSARGLRQRRSSSSSLDRAKRRRLSTPEPRASAKGKNRSRYSSSVSPNRTGRRHSSSPEKSRSRTKGKKISRHSSSISHDSNRRRLAESPTRSRSRSHDPRSSKAIIAPYSSTSDIPAFPHGSSQGKSTSPEIKETSREIHRTKITPDQNKKREPSLELDTFGFRRRKEPRLLDIDEDNSLERERKDKQKDEKERTEEVIYRRRKPAERRPRRYSRGDDRSSSRSRKRFRRSRSRSSASGPGHSNRYDPGPSSHAVYVDRRRRLDLSAAGRYDDHAPATVTEIHGTHDAASDKADNIWESFDDVLQDIDALTQEVEKPKSPEGQINLTINVVKKVRTPQEEETQEGRSFMESKRSEISNESLTKRQSNGNPPILTGDDIQRAMPKPMIEENRVIIQQEHRDGITTIVKNEPDRIYVQFIKKQISKNPRFVMPVKKLLNKMKTYTREVEEHKKATFFGVLRKILRLRIQCILKGKEYMKSSEIVELYRKQFREEEDEKFVKTVIQDMEDGKFEGFVASDAEEEVIKTEINKEHDPDQHNFNPYMSKKPDAINTDIKGSDLEHDDDVTIIEKKVDVIDLSEPVAQTEKKLVCFESIDLRSEDDVQIEIMDVKTLKKPKEDDIEEGEVVDDEIYEISTDATSDGITNFENDLIFVKSEQDKPVMDDDDTFDLSDQVAQMVNDAAHVLPELVTINDIETSLADKKEITKEDLIKEVLELSDKSLLMTKTGIQISAQAKEPEKEYSLDTGNKVSENNFPRTAGDTKAKNSNEVLPETVVKKEVIEPGENVGSIDTQSEIPGKEKRVQNLPETAIKTEVFDGNENVGSIETAPKDDDSGTIGTRSKENPDILLPETVMKTEVVYPDETITPLIATSPIGDELNSTIEIAGKKNLEQMIPETIDPETVIKIEVLDPEIEIPIEKSVITTTAKVNTNDGSGSIVSEKDKNSNGSSSVINEKGTHAANGNSNIGASGQTSIDVVKQELRDPEETVECIENFVNLITNVIHVDG